MPGKHKFLGRDPCEPAFRSRWQRSCPSAFSPRSRPTSAQLAPHLAGAQAALAADPGNPRRDPRRFPERPSQPVGVRRPWPPPAAPRQPAPPLSPACPGGRAELGTARSTARRGQPRREGAGVRVGGAGTIERCRGDLGGGRAAGGGSARSGREEGAQGSPGRAGSLTRDLRLGHVAQAEALGPVDLADFAAAPTLAGRVPASAGGQRGGRAQQPPASGPELHGGAGGAPGRARAAPAREGQSQGPGALGSRSRGAGRRGGGDNKSRRRRGAGRAGREDRPLARAAQSAAGERAVPARPLGGPGEGRGGARGAGRGARGGAGRGAARRGGAIRGAPGAPPAPRARGAAWLAPIRRLLEGSWVAGSARAAAGVPEGAPPTPSARGGGTTCGGGGGGAEAGLPPPDVTSRLPRAYQGLPRPQPKSASLPPSPFSARALPSCTLAARRACWLPQPRASRSTART